MKIEPLFDRVVLERIKEEQKKSASGLVLPESAQEQPLMAKVIAVGNGLNSEGKEIQMGNIKKKDWNSLSEVILDISHKIK